jgi:hypothetical protein
MAGKLDKALPKGRDRDGPEQQPDDGIEGSWTTQQRRAMDTHFAEAMRKQQTKRAVLPEKKPPR